MRFTVKFLHTVTPMILIMVMSGCTSAGLSQRETHQQNYSLYLYSLYDTAQSAADTYPTHSTRPPVARPASLAVAQIGEVAPPEQMLAGLRGDGALFRRVESIPGVTSSGPGPGSVPQQSNFANAELTYARRQMDRMQSFARDMGMDYLLVFGGTVDYGTHQTGLSLLDLTVVGAFVVPSREIKAQARASGALLDLHTNRVVLTASASTEGSRLGSAAGEKGDEVKLLQSVRDEVVEKLTKQFLAECHRTTP